MAGPSLEWRLPADWQKETVKRKIALTVDLLSADSLYHPGKCPTVLKDALQEFKVVFSACLQLSPEDAAAGAAMSDPQVCLGEICNKIAKAVPNSATKEKMDVQTVNEWDTVLTILDFLAGKGPILNPYLQNNWGPLTDEELVRSSGCKVVEGEIPADLRGVFAMVGPNSKYTHPDQHW